MASTMRGVSARPRSWDEDFQQRQARGKYIKGITLSTQPSTPAWCRETPMPSVRQTWIFSKPVLTSPPPRPRHIPKPHKLGRQQTLMHSSISLPRGKEPYMATIGQTVYTVPRLFPQFMPNRDTSLNNYSKAQFPWRNGMHLPRIRMAGLEKSVKRVVSVSETALKLLVIIPTRSSSSTSSTPMDEDDQLTDKPAAELVSIAPWQLESVKISCSMLPDVPQQSVENIRSEANLAEYSEHSEKQQSAEENTWTQNVESSAEQQNVNAEPQNMDEKVADEYAPPKPVVSFPFPLQPQSVEIMRSEANLAEHSEHSEHSEKQQSTEENTWTQNMESSAEQQNVDAEPQNTDEKVTDEYAPPKPVASFEEPSRSPQGQEENDLGK